MDAPLCRLCEKRHYGQCAVAKASPPAEKRSKAARSDDKVSEDDSPAVVLAPGSISYRVVDGVCPECGTDVGKLNARLEYQRDLMRRRRAARKGE